MPRIRFIFPSGFQSNNPHRPTRQNSTQLATKIQTWTIRVPTTKRQPILQRKTEHTKPENYMSWGTAFKGGIIQEITPEGETIWEHRDPYHHHDGRKTTIGGTIYLALEQVPKE